MIRSLTTTALVGACFAGATAQAAEVTFSGSVDAGLIAPLDTLADAPKYLYNLEANLTADIKLADNVSAQLYGAAVGSEVPTGGSTVSGGGRWPKFAFDGAAITWKLDDASSIVFGDIVYQKGSIGYYALKRYSTVSRVEAIKGVNYNYGGLSVYAGANDAEDSLFNVAGGYLATLAEGQTVEPFVDVTLGYSQNLPWSLGAQYKGKFGALSLATSATVFGADAAPVPLTDDAGDTVGVAGSAKHQIGYSIVVEPNYATDAFYVSSTFLFAPKAEAMGKGEYPIYSYPIRNGRFYNAIAEDAIVYVEPGINFAGGKAAFGLPVEWHEYDLSEDKTEKIALVPSFYLYPAAGASITLWAEMDNFTADDADPVYYAGLETIFKF